MVIEGTRMMADEGRWLTNGKTFGKVVVLGVNDVYENWNEITDEEYEVILNNESVRV